MTKMKCHQCGRNVEVTLSSCSRDESAATSAALSQAEADAYADLINPPVMRMPLETWQLVKEMLLAMAAFQQERGRDRAIARAETWKKFSAVPAHLYMPQLRASELEHGETFKLEINGPTFSVLSFQDDGGEIYISQRYYAAGDNIRHLPDDTIVYREKIAMTKQHKQAPRVPRKTRNF